jgi:hypothetical protein
MTATSKYFALVVFGHTYVVAIGAAIIAANKIALFLHSSH